MGELITGQAATYVEEMHINTKKRYEILCITRDVERIVAQSGIKDGLVLVNPMHITASCYVNDLEYGLHHDIMAWLEKLAPYHGAEGRITPSVPVHAMEGGRVCGPQKIGDRFRLEKAHLQHLVRVVDWLRAEYVES